MTLLHQLTRIIVVGPPWINKHDLVGIRRFISIHQHSHIWAWLWHLHRIMPSPHHLVMRHHFNECSCMFSLKIFVLKLNILLRDFSFDQMKHIPSKLDEGLVLKTLLVLDVASFVEVIHIHLTNEWSIVVVFEVLGEHLCRKCIRVIDNEAITSFVPENMLVKRLIVHNLIGGVYEVRYLLLEQLVLFLHLQLHLWSHWSLLFVLFVLDCSLLRYRHFHLIFVRRPLVPLLLLLELASVLILLVTLLFYLLIAHCPVLKIWTDVKLRILQKKMK